MKSLWIIFLLAATAVGQSIDIYKQVLRYRVRQILSHENPAGESRQLLGDLLRIAGPENRIQPDTATKASFALVTALAGL